VANGRQAQSVEWKVCGKCVVDGGSPEWQLRGEEPQMDPAGAGQARMGDPAFARGGYGVTWGMGNFPADLRRLAQMREGNCCALRAWPFGRCT